MNHFDKLYFYTQIGEENEEEKSIHELATFTNDAFRPDDDEDEEFGEDKQ